MRFACLVLVIAAGLPGSVRGDEVTQLPLTRIVAYTAGVAFCEHAGTVSGDAEVKLEFPIENIDDVLKSLVVLDLDGGKTSIVSYDNREPVARALGSLRIDLTQNPSLGDVLRQLRGQRIEVTLNEPAQGQIVGIERRELTRDDGKQQVEYLLLRTEAGLRTVPLSEIRLLRLLDEALDADFQQALDLLASSSDNRQRQVTIRFRGAGQRQVRIGYIREFPVWKVTYRLVLDDDGQALLQGWAIVENTTLADWENVNLALVSGRPISFRMDLYEPLYVQRPKVLPELFAGLAPRLYDPDIDIATSSVALGGRGLGGFGGGGGMFGGGMGGSYGGESEAAPAAPMAGRLGDVVESTEQVASGGDVGELFRYQIDVPVSLRREQSAMVPIVGAQVAAERLAIYNPAVNDKYPLNGLRLKNTTQLNWMAGPVAIFDGGEFAGDAQIGHIPPGSDRLLSYAVDLDTEVTANLSPVVQSLADARIVAGDLLLSLRNTRTATYVGKNSSDRPRLLLIERPIDRPWEISDTKQPSETTRNVRRYSMECAVDSSAKLDVEEWLLEEQRLTVNQLSDVDLTKYLAAPQVAENLKQTLRRYIEVRRRLIEIRLQQGQRRSELDAISEEQTRIRNNMAELDRDNELYQRYLEKLNEQESAIERLRSELNVLLEQERQASAELDPPAEDGE